LDPESVTLWIRIGNPDPGARKGRNFSGKRHFLVIFLLILPIKRYKIALTTFDFKKVRKNREKNLIEG
jgi:hypothetical protein